MKTWLYFLNYLLIQTITAPLFDKTLLRFVCAQIFVKYFSSTKGPICLDFQLSGSEIPLPLESQILKKNKVALLN